MKICFRFRIHFGNKVTKTQKSPWYVIHLNSTTDGVKQLNDDLRTMKEALWELDTGDSGFIKYHSVANMKNATFTIEIVEAMRKPTSVAA